MMVANKRILLRRLLQFNSLTFLIFLCSCSHNFQVIKDFALAPVEHNQGRAETVLCGHYAVGDNICWVKDGDNLADLELEVRTYFNGKINLYSSDCDIDIAYNYRNSEPYKIRLSKIMKATVPGSYCVIDINVNPYFPSGKKFQQVRSLSARAVLYHLDDTTHKLASVVGTEFGSGLENDDFFYAGSGLMSMRNSDTYNLTKGFSIFVPNAQSGSIVIAGCGTEGRYISYGPFERSVFIPLLSFFDDPPFLEHCLLYGEVVPDDDLFRYAFMVGVEIYSNDIVNLSDPHIRASEEGIVYQTLDPVNWTFIDDGEIKYRGSGSIEADYNAVTSMFFITSQGRAKSVKVFRGEVIWSR